MKALWRWRGRLMLKIKIAAGSNVFEVETDAGFTEIAKYLDLWFGVIDTTDLTQAQIDQLTARVAAANDKLRTAVANNTPATT